jgi:phosphoglycerate dehydrogenase-like enzyme
VSRAVRAVVPQVIADRLDATGSDWLEVVAWDGEGAVPEPAHQAQVWVPPYGVAQSPDFVRDSLAAMGALEVVQLQSAGVEPWQSLVPDGVTLCNGRGVHGGSTAELAVALVLATVRDLPQYVEQQRRRTWEPLTSGTLAGQRVLVVGAGDIGRRAAAVLTALEAEVTLVGRRRREGVVTWDDARNDLGRTDVLLLAVPRTPETERLVDAEVLAALPDGALVVNVARGAVLDTEALTAEVAAGRLRTGLDVTDPEPLPQDHPLWTLPGALLTPHVGGGATGWEDRARDLVADQLERLHEGRELRNVVADGY